MTCVTIKNLTIAYDDFIVMRNFNAEFSLGIHWIQGINGSGKSSLLKSLCGIIPIDPGHVFIKGKDLATNAKTSKKKLCYVPDKPEVYPFMTGLQFLRLVAEIRAVKLDQTLFDFMDAINLTCFSDTAFAEMSFGTRRKFVLCSIFIGNPQILLLDEPFNGLDKNTIAQFKHWLLQAKQHKCILMISHDNHLIEDLHDSHVHLS